MSAGVPATLLDRAQAWLADDPDPATREELRGVLDAAGRGKPRAEVDLADRFAGTLEFGTAGLRGRIGAGPNRMNRAVVIRAAAGLTAYLQQARPDPLVVIGYDARHRSADFATDTAAVVVGAGARAALLPGPLPTPVLAYAIRHLGADAGVMVTASHNPPQDNGYKVYLGDGSQIVAPADARIAERITAVPSVAGVARAERGWEVLGPQLRAAYVAACVMVVAPESAREIRVVHTALHGVGGALVRDCFEAAGFAAPVPVPSQQDPDPDFPTVPFPNPEEPGVMGAAFATAARVRPDIVIASDPDADRCAVGVPDSQAPGGWRMLHGDEVGALLGAHILARGVEPGRVLASSVVSSRLLGVLAKAAGVGHRETLTGFKWISRVPGLRYGYEEALGYCVAPEAVRDKDGISAALLVAELAAGLRSQGRTLVDRLDDLARTHGLYVSDALAVRVADLGLLGELMDRLRSRPPQRVGEAQVSTRQDLRDPAGDLPPTDALRYHLADGSRVIVRPSGTEPKLKVYLEAVVPVLPAGSVADARSEAARRLGAMRASMRHLLDGAAPAPAASHQRQHHREQEQHTATGE